MSGGEGGAPDRQGDRGRREREQRRWNRTLARPKNTSFLDLRLGWGNNRCREFIWSATCGRSRPTAPIFCRADAKPAAYWLACALREASVSREAASSVCYGNAPPRSKAE